VGEPLYNPPEKAKEKDKTKNKRQKLKNPRLLRKKEPSLVDSRLRISGMTDEEGKLFAVSAISFPTKNFGNDRRTVYGARQKQRKGEGQNRFCD